MACTHRERARDGTRDRAGAHGARVTAARLTSRARVAQRGRASELVCGSDARALELLQRGYCSSGGEPSSGARGRSSFLCDEYGRFSGDLDGRGFLVGY